MQDAIAQFIAYVPKEVSESVMPAVNDIIYTQDGGLLTLSILGTLWVLMVGVDALRMGLNHAYGVAETRNYLFTKFQSLVFVLVLTFAFIFAAMLIILGPLLMEGISSWIAILPYSENLLHALRYGYAICMLVLLLSVTYYYLPNVRQRVRGVLPGALIGTLLWVGLASLFSLFLSNVGHYNATYGSLSGIIITLVFLQFSAAIFLFGAEVNAVTK